MFSFMMGSLPDWDDEEAVRSFKEIANSMAEHVVLSPPSGKSSDEYYTGRSPERHPEGSE